MGEKVVAGGFDLSDRQRYRRKLQQCLAGLERLLAEKRFDRPKNLMGLEIELNLAGADGLPRMMNAQVLERIASRDFQTELGHVQSGSQHRSRTGLAAGYSTSSPRSCAPASAYADRQGARGRRRDRDDRHSADARQRRPGLREPLRRRPLHAAQRPDRGGPR